jgi:putative heme-binding domain-containing protein
MAALLWTLAVFGQTEEVRNPHDTPKDVALGAKTFRSHCAECHGLNGEGGRGPRLASGEFYHGSSDAELLKNISDGIPGTEMPGLFYSPDRVWQVVAYLRSISEASGTGAKGNRSAGEALFTSAGCAGCHRIAGKGARMGPDLTNIGKIRSSQHLREAVLNPDSDVRQRYWLVELARDDGKPVTGFLMNEDTYTVQLIDFGGQLHSYAKSGLSKYSVSKKSKMPSYKDKLKESQVDDLVAYLSSLRPVTKGNQ